MALVTNGGGINGGVSSCNSTEDLLIADAVYTGEWEDVSKFATISIIYESDVLGATDGLELQFSADGVTPIRTKSITTSSTADGDGHFGGVHTLSSIARYFRVRYTNGSSVQLFFQLQTILSQTRNKHLTSSLNQTITDADDVELTRTVLMGKTSGGHYGNVAIDPVTNAMQVAITGPTSAFGEAEVTDPTPIIQGNFLYNINSDIYNTDVTNGTVTQADAMAVLQTSANINSHAEVCTKALVKYRPGQGTHVRFTALFTTGVAGSKQMAGGFDDDNGFGFGYNGDSFGLFKRSGGVDLWVAQEDWNGDLMDGSGNGVNPSNQTLDQTKGNVYQVQFQWLGFGNIVYGIEDSNSGRFVPVHTIKYANTAIVPSLINPAFPVRYRVENTTNNTNITLKGSSLAAEVEGQVIYLGPSNSIGNTKTGVTTTLTNILTIRNKTSFASKTNKAAVVIKAFSIAVDGAKPAELQLIKDTTLGGSPSFSDISTNTSVVDFDTAGTIVSGGTVIDTLFLGKSDSEHIEPVLGSITLNPGETLTLAVAASSTTTDSSVSIVWVEDF